MTFYTSTGKEYSYQSRGFQKSKDLKYQRLAGFFLYNLSWTDGDKNKPFPKQLLFYYLIVAVSE